MSPLDEITSLFSRHGAQSYFGESVSMAGHSLQTAHAGQLEGAPAALIVAALLHDIGHLVEDVPDDLLDWKTDARHEEVGSGWLALRFGPEIYEPVRLHVPAKRYLCAADRSYFARLSSASARTLELQGGPMSAAEMATFERERFFADAVRIRRWDDLGKTAGVVTPALSAYASLISQCSRNRV
jgi:phosphonate degradation associated HDIG domain protein